MSCPMANTNSCRSVAKINTSAQVKRPNVECALRDGNTESKVEYLFQQAVQQYRANMTVNIDYANEYLTRAREADLGTLAFFIVDDLLETLNLDATRVLFESESGFQLKRIKDADTIRLMYHLAENVKLLDTVAEKTMDWFRRYQQTGAACSVNLEEDIWDVWDKLNLSEYIRMYKEMYESMPGDESRTFYESTSLHTLLHECNPDRTAQVIEYTVSNADPAPICSVGGNSSCKFNSSKKISNASLRNAAQSSVRKRNNGSLSCSMRSLG